MQLADEGVGELAPFRLDGVGMLALGELEGETMPTRRVTALRSITGRMSGSMSTKSGTPSTCGPLAPFWRSTASAGAAWSASSAPATRTRRA
jgi:hypothetical protein